MSGKIYGTSSDVYLSNRVTLVEYPEYDRAVITYHKKTVRQSGWDEIIRGAEDMFDSLTVERSGHTSEEDKQARTLRRVRSTCRDLLFSNRWTFWVTLTVSPDKLNRYSFDEILKELEKIIKARNRKRKTSLQYLLIPERHKDGAYHLHGFLSGLGRDEVVKNQFGYLTIPLFSGCLGFDNVRRIDHKPTEEKYKILGYTLKYAVKSVEDGGTKHHYYHSQGLKKSEKQDLIAKDEFVEYIKGMEGFENEYCKKIELRIGDWGGDCLGFWSSARLMMLSEIKIAVDRVIRYGERFRCPMKFVCADLDKHCANCPIWNGVDSLRKVNNDFYAEVVEEIEGAMD